MTVMLLRGACGRCDYAATVGIGRDEEATVPVHWAPAHCPACGLVSVNVYSYGADSDPRCHECDELVEFYVDWGMIPRPPDGWPCPACGSRALGFSFFPSEQKRLWATLSGDSLGGHRFCQLASSATLPPMPRNWKSVVILLLGTVTSAVRLYEVRWQQED